MEIVKLDHISEEGADIAYPLNGVYGSLHYSGEIKQDPNVKIAMVTREIEGEILY